MSLCIGLTLSPIWLNGDGWRNAFEELTNKKEGTFFGSYFCIY